MRSIIKFLAFVFIGLSFVGCEVDSGENFHFVSLEATGATFPETFQLNQTHEILVNYRRPDDCTYFEGFDVLTTDSNTRNVVAIGSVLTNEECTATNDIVEATLFFRVLYDQTYLFRFYSGEDEAGEPIYLEYEVEVTGGNSNQ